jgi:hypothetical protein
MGGPKVVNFQLIRDEKSEAYQILEEMLIENHEELEDVRVALAWRKALKGDVDGHLILGKCIKVSDLHKEFAAYDFIILLNQEIWQSPEFTEDKKKALIDHELCHAAPAMDKKTGAQKEDERGRLQWRIRKHDIEEFEEIVKRHGTYKKDLERFAEALIESKQGRLEMAESKV